MSAVMTDIKPVLDEKENSSSLGPHEGKISSSTTLDASRSDHLTQLPVEQDMDRDVEQNGIQPVEQVDLDEKDPKLIVWDGPDDPGNSLNWSKSKKWILTVALALMTLTITFASSIFSTGTLATSKEYRVSTEVTTLGTSLFVLGFALGPMVWGPFSELYGRVIPLMGSFTVFMIFQIPVATAQNLQTIMIARFLGGVFGSAPLAIAAGAIADCWNSQERGIPVTIFAAMTFIGPVIGPIIGSFVAQSYLGWRWTQWVTMILAAIVLVLSSFMLHETFEPVLLQRRAKKIRHETRDWAIHSKLDETRVDFHEIIVTYLQRPLKMIILEPILLLVTIYMSLIYGILYLFFEAYPISFAGERRWTEGLSALPFLAIIVGVVFGVIFVGVIVTVKGRKSPADAGEPVPERILPAMALGGIILPGGLFWFGWTSSPHITWVPQVISGIPMGFGILLIFMSGIGYIIDVYQTDAGSAIAANTFVRSFFGAGFPLFAAPMYRKLGVPWASSLLGFLAAIMAPVPILFFIFGAKIRRMSRFSPT